MRRGIHWLTGLGTVIALAVPTAASAGLVTQYHLDALPADGSVADSSGNNLNGGARAGSAAADGRFGPALHTAATGDGFNVTNDARLEPRRLTVAAWVRKSGPNFVYRTIVGKGGVGCSDSTWALYTDANGGLAFYVDSRNAANQPTFLRTPQVAPAQIWDNQWHAIAGTFDGHQVALWIDGVQVRTSAYADDAPIQELDYARQASEKRLQIGRYDEAGCSAGGFQYLGDIDEVQLYDRVLSDAELATLQNPAATSPPVISDPPGPPPPPPPPPEVNLTVPKVLKSGAAPGLKDTVRYTCSDGTWSGLSPTNVFKYQWYNDDGIRMSDGQLFPPLPYLTTKTIDITPRFSGRKFFCTVTAKMNSGQRVTAKSKIVVVSSLITTGLIELEEQTVGNFGIRGIDVFQVTQPNAGAQMYAYNSTPRTGQAFGAKCGAGVSSNRIADCSGFFGNPQEASYDGVHLDSLKPTSAFVYVDRDVVVSGAQQVEVLLQGGIQGQGTMFNTTLHQTFTPPTSKELEVTDAERGTDASSVRFDLPQDWIRQAAFAGLPSLMLKATVRLPTGSYPKVECSLLDSCRDDDTFTLSGIPIRRKFYALRIQPIPVLTKAQVASGFSVNPADQVLKGVTDLYPGGGAFEILPYAAPLEVNVDDIIATSPTCPGPTELKDLPESPTSMNARVRGCRSNAVFDAVKAWRAMPANKSGYDILAAVHRYSTGTFVEPGTSNGPISSATAAGAQPIMHINDGSEGRPLTAAGHEFGHTLGALHADFNQRKDDPAPPATKLSCNGNDDGQVGEPWPSDNRGRLQGVKYDPATHNRTVDTTASPLYDLMSYCTGDATGWLSPRNWNHFENTVTLLAEKNPTTRAVFAPRATPSGGLVTGLYYGGAAHITSVVPAAAGVTPPASDPASFLRIRSSDAAGKPLGEVGAQVELQTDVPGAVSFSAPLPATAARVELVLGGAVVDQRAASRPPTVKLSSPRAGSRARRGLTVRWTASDPEGKPLSATVQFAPSSGAQFRTVFSGPNSGTAKIPAGALQAAAKARVRVIVNDGFTVGIATSKAFRADGVAPRTRIILPAPGRVTGAGTRIILVGQAFDDAGRELKGSRLTWFAGTRAVGTGSPLRANLPAGRVAVRLVARDRLGRTTTVRRTLTVSPIALDIKSLNAAPTVTAKARLLKVRVAVTTPAVLRAGGRSYSVTTRAQTVSVGLPSKPATGLLRVPLKFTARGPKQPVVTTTLLVNRG